MRFSPIVVALSFGIITVAKAQCPLDPTSNCTLNIDPSVNITGSVLAGGSGTTTTDANNNQVNITGGSATGIVGAAQSQTGTANNNSIIMDSGNVGLDLVGGRSANNTANNNTITINGGTVGREVVSGYSDTNNVINNTTTLNGGTVTTELHGGIGDGDNSIIQGNQTIINGGDVLSGAFAGVGRGQITSNTLTITGGHVHQDAVAGQNFTTATTPTVTGNTATISGTAQVDGSLAGGRGPGIVTQNTVTVDGGTVGNGVYGGFGQAGFANATVSQNQTIINAGQVTGTVAGGISDGAVTDNSATLTGGSVNGSVYGGSSRVSGAVTGNSVQVGDGVQITGGAYGGSGVGDASNNQATVTGGQIGGDVVGGASSGGAATNNTVSLTNAQVTGNFIGGSGATTVTGNTATVTDGSVQGDVYGGFGTSSSAITTDNTVTLLGGTIQGGVFGGSSTDKTGNTLNLHGFQGSVREVNNFQNYSIVLPDNIVNGGTMVHITGGNATDMSGATVTDFNFAAGNAHYQAGDKMKIIDSATDDGSFVDKTFNQVRKGPTAAYDVLVATENNALTATILGQTVAPQSRNVGTSRVATQTLLNQGADLVSENGINQAWGPNYDCQRDGKWSFFSSFAYGKNQLDDHLDANGSSMLAGMAWRKGATCDTGFLGGVFFEAGNGDYDGHSYRGSYNTFNGDVKYYGMGLLSRYRFQNHVRVEGAVRFGRLESDYHGVDYGNNVSSRYDLNTNYYGLYLGTGYDIDLTDRLNLDLSAKYFWLHQQGKSVTVDSEKLKFENTDSHRVRTGGRLSYAATNTISPYAGAYYEYEFDGKVNAYNKTVAMKHDRLDIMQGNSGVMEVGVMYKPTQLKNLTLDVGARGQAGKREGYLGYANLTWNF